MLLKPGNSGPLVKALQRGLNKLGSLLLVDGDFGPATSAAVLDARTVLQQPGLAEADDALQSLLASLPDPFPPLTAAGVTFIARQEVTGPREYRRKYSTPVWPSAESGITIGIGYDLQFVDVNQLRNDWATALTSTEIALLGPVCGARGSLERLNSVREIVIPLPKAMAVFVQSSLPRYDAQTRAIYPETVNLPAPRRTALVSLVYNRGTRLVDRDPVRQERREMREIRELLASGQLDGVADRFEQMVRLSDPDRVPGLIRRRRDEARLWRSGFEALQLD